MCHLPHDAHSRTREATSREPRRSAPVARRDIERNVWERRYTCLSYVGCGRTRARLFCKANITKQQDIDKCTPTRWNLTFIFLRSGSVRKGRFVAKGSKLKPGVVLGPTFFRLPRCLSQARSALVRLEFPIRFDHSQSQNPWGLFRLLSAHAFVKMMSASSSSRVNRRRRLGSELLTFSFVIPNHSHTRRARYPTAF